MDERKIKENIKKGVSRGSSALLDILDNVDATVSDVLPNIAKQVGEQVRQATAAAPQKASAVPQKAPAAPMKAAKENREVMKNKGMPRGGTVMVVFGIIMAVCGVAFSLGVLITMLAAFSAWWVVLLTLTIGLTAAGGFLAAGGKLRKSKKIRFENYKKLIGDKTAISVHALADAAGTSYKKTLNDLKEMILRGVLSPAWLDMKKYRLMLSEYTQEDMIPDTDDGHDEGCLTRSAQILRQIRADNDLIDDEEVSAKIDRIEDLTRKIFEIVDRYPEKEKQLYSFLNYYLPTTLKSLENYARLEAQGIETESIKQAKQKINEMLDELASGYEKQLDKLFEDDVLDISADIEVMRQMLQRDGLTEDEITRK